MGFNGDGARVKATLNGTTIVYLGNYFVPGDPHPRDFNWNDTTSSLTKYYYAGAARVALRGAALRYLLSDYLGSTTISITWAGSYYSELRYKPWGETRYIDGTPPTRYQYTGQYSYTAEFGLYFFNARWYDLALGRFAQADTLVPEPGNASASSAQAPQAFDRYAYSLNNPIRYIDPSGHLVCSEIYWEEDCNMSEDEEEYIFAKRSGTKFSEGTSDKPGGKELWELYLKYKHSQGWWNNNGASEFTVEDFIGLILVYELGGITSAMEHLLEAAGRQVWVDATSVGGHMAYCIVNGCVSGIFNFLAEYSQSSWEHWRTDFKVNSGPPFRPAGFDHAKEVGKILLTPPTEWKSWNYDRPYHWGNDDELKVKLDEANIGYGFIGYNNNQIVYRKGNFVIYTPNQSNFWK